MLTGVLAADCLGLLVLVNITEYWMVIPFGLLFGIGFGGMQPTRNVLISEYFGTRNFASIYGLLTSVHILFGIAAPLMVGFSADFTGSYKRPSWPYVRSLLSACPSLGSYEGQSKPKRQFIRNSRVAQLVPRCRSC